MYFDILRSSRTSAESCREALGGAVAIKVEARKQSEEGCPPALDSSRFRLAMASHSALCSAPRLLRRPVPSSIRQLSTRPHPLSSRITPSGPVPAGRTPPRLAPKVQRWSTLTAILLATLTGSATYIVGLQAGKPAPALSFKEPTQANFDTAVKELASWIPEDCLAQDRDSLVSHGHSDWAGERGDRRAGERADPSRCSSTRSQGIARSRHLPSDHRGCRAHRQAREQVLDSSHPLLGRNQPRR